MSKEISAEDAQAKMLAAIDEMRVRVVAGNSKAVLLINYGIDENFIQWAGQVHDMAMLGLVETAKKELLNDGP